MAIANLLIRIRNRQGLTMDCWTAKWYAGTTARQMGQYVAWARKVSESVGPGAHVLEVAPGPGYLSIALAGLGDYRVVGMDLSPDMVEIARRKAAEAGAHVDFRQGDAHYMPFVDDRFDFIVCTAAFKNFPEPVRVLDEMHRVLKRNGRALIIDLRKDASMREINKGVDAMGLGIMNSFFTKLVFKYGLRKIAYTKDQMNDFARRSRFIRCDTVETGMGIEVMLRKQ